MEELFYTIDKARTELAGALAITIQLGEKTGLVYQASNKHKLLNDEVLARFATPKDHSILPFLIKEERAFKKKHRTPQETVQLPYVAHVPFSLSAQVMKLFATSGKLHFEGKALTVDLFGKNEFFYFVDTTITPPSTKGCIKSLSQEFDVTNCQFICKGPPHFFIKGLLLKFITTEISWKDLKAAYLEQIREPQELLEEAKEEVDAPRVILNASNYTFQEKEPLPTLILQDRLGAFADLWMSYGNEVPLISLENPSPNILDQNGALICKRLTAIELEWEKDLFETSFIKKTVDSSHYYCPVDKVAKSLSFLLELGWTILDSKGNHVLLHRHSELKTETNAKTIAVKGKLHYGSYQADLTTIVGAFNRSERFAQIAPGHVALLPNDFETIGLSALIEEGEIVGDGVTIKRSGIGSLSTLFQSQPNLKFDDTLQEMKERLESFQGIEPAYPSPLFKGELRPYQQEGLNWLAYLFEFRFHGLLADDMGLGKTVQVLAFLSRLKLTSPVLIVMPTSLIFNWKKEIERFLPGYSFTIHHGEGRAKTTESLDQPQLIITTYTTLRLDFALFSPLSFACLILDEAQAIKNAHTQTSETARLLNSQFRLSMTGTPIENNLLELWSHFHFLTPDLFGTEESFKKEILAGASDPRFFKRIKRKIRPFLLRRQKEEVAKDLPEKIEQTVWVEMGDCQRALYEEFLSGIRQRLIKKVSVDGVPKHRMEVLEAIMRLRQMCCHPLLINTEGAQNCPESAKLDALMNDLETAVKERRKVLIYSQFTSMLSLIAKKVQENHWPFVYLDGKTKDRENVVTEFQENPNIPLFLISLKAGGVGLNLTSADYVFLFDPWWNNAIENQAIDRAHRIGRKETVIAKRYIIQESIEEKMMKLKESKCSLAEELLDEGTMGTGLSADDLFFLLS